MRKSGAPSNRNTQFQSSFQRRIAPQNLSNLAEPFTPAQSKENRPTNSESGKVCFRVVWNKRTTKKHKTWEGDGTLEGSHSTFFLKDLEGNFLGSSNSLKPEELFDGSRLVIGSKEVEIQERIQSSHVASVKTKNEESSEDCTVPKKRKSNNVFKTTLHMGKIKLPSTSSLVSTPELAPFILPAPNYSHQWKYNEATRPISEVKVANSLLRAIRPHQRAGIIFLYECIQGFRNVDHSGAILADEMGLGKTLQCLTVCHTLLKQGPYGSDPVLRRILIVTPSSLTHHWSDEITKWLSSERLFAYIVDAKNKPKQYPNTGHVPFVITSYEMLVKNCDEFEQIKFDLVVCDEGHRLKNNSIKAAISLRQLNIKRRIILTGTPIQNDLQEFFALVDFVNPGVLGDYAEYKFQYETPIVQSQSPESSEEAKEIGKERAQQLNRITGEFILRRTQSINREYLPKKTEFIVFVKPTELQQFMLQKVLEWYEAKQDSAERNYSPLQIITVLKKICNHPSLIKTTSQLDSPLLQYLLQILPDWKEMGPFDSAKLELVQNFLKEAITVQNERIVLVSNHTKTLDMLMELCAHSNYSYLRLDGSTSSSERNSIVERFNRAKSEISVFLLSSKAGGVGLNLSGASRLVLFDNDWNPATDLQAMSRIWRDGQKRDVKTYRLITAGTIEEKIFQRQIAKTSLGGCVMMDQASTIDTMKFSNEELKDLFTVQEDFETCSTHSILNCDCSGLGEKTETDKMIEEKNPFDVVLFNDAVKENSLQMNELMRWKHFKSPISADILKEACLTNATEDVIFMFSNTTEVTTAVLS